ncbi:S-layer homology domain-containing protein [Actinomarinicola tropica]|nr:S-layer homology domain-containing protein [Actinomarinicola tropica]
MTSRRARRTIFTLVAALSLLLPGVAQAAPGYDGTELILTVDDQVKDQGDTVTFSSVEGCEPETDVTISFGGFDVATVTADLQGGFAGSFDVEDDQLPGTFPVTATCAEFTDTLDLVVIDRQVFRDTIPDAFYELGVAWAYARGITTGVGGTEVFAPVAATTRGETVTFLWRLVGEPSGHDDAGFSDTIDDAFYEDAVNWAAAEGITTGVGGSDEFQPDRPVTRGEFVTFLWRALGEPPAPPAGFADTIPNAFYDDAVDWAADTEVTTGVGGSNNFEPARNVTRGEAVTFMYRAAVWAGGTLGPA